MLKIRLRRMGSTHKPFYRVVVSDSRRTPLSSAIDEIGFYDPRKKPSMIQIDLDRVDYWQSRGAQVSDTVRRLVRTAKEAPAEATAEATPTPEATPAQAQGGEAPASAAAAEAPADQTAASEAAPKDDAAPAAEAEASTEATPA